jgi:hypothetical protein
MDGNIARRIHLINPSLEFFYYTTTLFNHDIIGFVSRFELEVMKRILSIIHI